jgi:murein peptide amidase A
MYRAVCCAALAFVAVLAGPAVARGPEHAGEDLAHAARTESVPVRIGRSVEGRPIGLLRLGSPDATRTVLVVGCIHGNEGAGRMIVERLARIIPADAPARFLLVRDMNPDGLAHGTRQNAHGVDLNRNGSVGHRYLGPLGTPFYSGHEPFSEPESRAVRALILRERPQIVIWYHQPLARVDVPEAGWDGRARRYARLVGLPLRPLPHYPGSLSRWTNVRVRAGSSFVVELPGGTLSAAAVQRHAAAVLTLSGVAPGA